MKGASKIFHLRQGLESVCVNRIAFFPILLSDLTTFIKTIKTTLIVFLPDYVLFQFNIFIRSFKPQSEFCIVL